MALSPIIRIVFLCSLLQSCGSTQPETPAGGPKWRGMTFAHEGYQGFNGYGGETVAPSLDSLASLNVNALAIVPYTFMPGPQGQGKLPIPDREGSETDAAVLHSVSEAHRRGWRVLLKPQIWIGGGHWPGDVDYTTEAEWATFFTNYGEWILHYADLAEAHDIEALCIGTELVNTTLKQPDRWRSLIAQIRARYSGTLTYAANWGEEFENLTFWDALDVIGLNSYYPLSDKDRPTDAELLAGARRWVAMADDISRKQGRPLWLTEVGYRSVENAWVNPHAHTEGRARDPRCQERCFAALTQAVEESERLEGMFVWKWPSYLGYDGGRWAQGMGFTVGGKPAAAVLGEFYRGW